MVGPTSAQQASSRRHGPTCRVPRKAVALVGPGVEARGGIAAQTKALVGSALAEQYRFVPIETYREGAVALKLVRAVGGIGRLAWLLARRRVDLVHVNSASGTSFVRKLAAVGLARGAATPIVFHVHGGGFLHQLAGTGLWAGLRRRAVLWALRQADVVVALTDGWAEAIAGWIPESRVRVVPNTPDLVPLPREPAPPQAAPTIAFLGHLDRDKGLFELLDAVALLRDGGTTVELVLAGVGHDEEALRRHAVRLGLRPPHVVFPGWLAPEEKARLLARASCFVLPSYDEGLPLALLESLASGTPVVASAVGGVPDVVRDGVEALLVPARDAHALAEAIQHVVADPELAARLGEAGRARAAAEFGVDAVAGRMGEVYEEALGHARPHLSGPSIPESVYERLPVALQGAAVSAAGWRQARRRYNAEFDALLAEAEVRSSWSDDRLFDYRDRRIQAFVAHAAATVPYYRRLFEELDVAPGEIRTVEDLARLPLLQKTDVRRGREFLSEAVPPRVRLPVHTSGSTGTALVFASTPRAVQEQWATYWRYFRWHGIDRGTLCALFTGHRIVPLSQAEPPFWRESRPTRQIIFSPFHMSPGTLDAYLGELRRRRPPWLHGYPSLLGMLAAYMLGRGYDLGYQPRWVTVGAENVLPLHVETIERAFGVRPRQHYGMTEAIANVSECERGALHVDEDFAALELVPAGEGRASIVGTNFSNPATPLLRYEIHDLAVPGVACACGRPGRVIASIDGRAEDVLLQRNGAVLGVADEIFRDSAHVCEAQIRQERAGAVELRIVRGEGYTGADEQALLRAARSRLGEDMEVSVTYVDRLERTANGKLRFVVSTLSQADALALFQSGARAA